MTPNQSFLDFLKSFATISVSSKIRLLGLCFKNCWLIKFQDSLKCNISRKKQIMKFILGMPINIEVVYKLIPSFQVCVARHVQSTQNKKLAYLCNSPQKTLGMKLVFFLKINTKIFYKLIVSLWVCVACHFQSTQNNKFAISLQYLIENREG